MDTYIAQLSEFKTSESDTSNLQSQQTQVRTASLNYIDAEQQKKNLW